MSGWRSSSWGRIGWVSDGLALELPWLPLAPAALGGPERGLEGRLGAFHLWPMFERAVIAHSKPY